MPINSIKPVVTGNKNMFFLNRTNKIKQPIIKDDANHIVKNIHFNFWNTAIFKLLDKVSNHLQKHPKICKGIMSIAQKMIVENNEIKEII